MGGLHAADIFILLLVCAISVLVIFFRIRLRRKAMNENRKCGGNCGSCRGSCNSFDSTCDTTMFKKDIDGK